MGRRVVVAFVFRRCRLEVLTQSGIDLIDRCFS